MIIIKEFKKITILHSNDMHGDFMAESNNGRLIGGVSMLSGYLQRVRAEEKNVLYTISGDMLRGSVIDSEYKGISTIEIMNMLLPDVATVGNHEMDYGIAHSLFLEKCARFPIICANLRLKTTQKRLFKGHLVREIDGMRVLFIGIISEAVLAQARQEELVGTYVDVGEATVEVGRICNAHKTEDVDLTVLLTHIGFKADKELAAALDPRWGIDLIIGGHSHTELKEPCVVAGIPIVQAACGTDRLGRFDITVDTSRNRIDSYSWRLIPIDAEHCPRDKALESLISKYNAATKEKYGRYITRFADVYTHPTRDRETQLGRIFADILKNSLGLDIMLLASGSLRNDKMGPIVTLQDLTQMFPFEDEVFKITVTGKQFKEMIRYLYRPSALEGDHSEFYQFSHGVRVVVSHKEQRVLELSFNGKPIRDNAILHVGLQGYHYRNMKDIFNLGEEEISACKVLATSAMDVIDENMSRLDLVVCPEDERWITV